jgi:hypothetical protein
VEVSIEKKCIKTGQTYYDERTTKQGLEKHVEELNVDKDTWKEISKIRNKIAHDSEAFHKLYEDCIRLTPDTYTFMIHQQQGCRGFKTAAFL